MGCAGASFREELDVLSYEKLLLKIVLHSTKHIGPVKALSVLTMNVHVSILLFGDVVEWVGHYNFQIIIFQL